MSYMLELEKKLRDLLNEYREMIEGGKSSEGAVEAGGDRIVKYVKSKVVESYRNGEKGIKSSDLRKKGES